MSLISATSKKPSTSSFDIKGNDGFLCYHVIFAGFHNTGEYFKM